MANSIDELKSYREVVDHFKQARRKINLLLGNGFSIAYDRGIFSYNALSRFIMDSDDETIKRVFQVYHTQNSESIMHHQQATVLSATQRRRSLRHGKKLLNVYHNSVYFQCRTFKKSSL